MRDGRILQVGTPAEVYRAPATVFVARFVGSPRMTLWTVWRDGSGCRCGDARLAIAPPDGAPGEILAGIRPEDVVLAATPNPDGFEATVEGEELMGAQTLLTLRCGEARLRALAAPGSWSGRVWVRWPAESVHWFDPTTERRLPGASGKGGG
jgi:ABC-type sugar transport system ATPase subunit